MLYPALLIPLLVWICARYVRLLDGAGMLRVGLAMVLVGGLLGTQMLGIQRAGYPLSTWTMYSSPDPSNVIWDLRIVEGDRTFHYPWKRLAPVQEVRGIHLALAARAEQVFEGPVPDRGTGAEAAVRAGDEAEARLAGILVHLGRLFARRAPPAASRTLELRRCEVDFRDLRPRAETECPLVLSVPIEASDGA